MYFEQILEKHYKFLLVFVRFYNCESVMYCLCIILHVLKMHSILKLTNGFIPEIVSDRYGVGGFPGQILGEDPHCILLYTCKH